jgi:hypothetical protein
VAGGDERPRDPAEHALLRTLLENIRTPQEKLLRDPQAKLTLPEWYDTKVFQCAFNLVSILDRSELAAHLAPM